MLLLRLDHGRLGSDAGSYFRLIDFVCHFTTGLRVIKKKIGPKTRYLIQRNPLYLYGVDYRRTYGLFPCYSRKSFAVRRVGGWHHPITDEEHDGRERDCEVLGQLQACGAADLVGERLFHSCYVERRSPSKRSALEGRRSLFGG